MLFLRFNFITSVFDSDVLIDQEGNEYTQVGGINIFFNEVGKRSSYPKSFFSFEVKNSTNLEDLKSKIEFSFYRDNLGKPKYELFDKSLEFSDPDGNKWVIELDSQILMNISQVILQDNVRNY
jgi:hypothetical protein